MSTIKSFNQILFRCVCFEKFHQHFSFQIYTVASWVSTVLQKLNSHYFVLVINMLVQSIQFHSPWSICISKYAYIAWDIVRFVLIKVTWQLVIVLCGGTYANNDIFVIIIFIRLGCQTRTNLLSWCRHYRRKLCHLIGCFILLFTFITHLLMCEYISLYFVVCLGMSPCQCVPMAWPCRGTWGLGSHKKTHVSPQLRFQIFIKNLEYIWSVAYSLPVNSDSPPFFHPLLLTWWKKIDSQLFGIINGV